MIFIERRADQPQPQDVLQALKEDFHNKCYLCESQRRAAQIEHLKPQIAFPQLAPCWTNKFLACGGSCNQRRLHWETKANAEQHAGKPIR